MFVKIDFLPKDERFPIKMRRPFRPINQWGIDLPQGTIGFVIAVIPHFDDDLTGYLVSFDYLAVVDGHGKPCDWFWFDKQHVDHISKDEILVA